MRITYEILKVKDEKGALVDTLVRITSTDGSHSFHEPLFQVEDYIFIKEENEKLNHLLKIHHNHYQCVPRSVMDARIQTLEEELGKLKKKKNSRN